MLKDHIPPAGDTLCGKRNWSAVSCPICLRRFEQIVDALLNCAEDRPNAPEQAARLIEKLGIARECQPSELPSGEGE